jgi:DNA-directed RNA polymerase subunit omega
MRDDYLKNALTVIDDPNILVNVVSQRVKQLRRGSRPLVESLEKLSPEDTALREIAERKITYELATPEELELKTTRAYMRGAVAVPAKYKTDKQAQTVLSA